MSRDDEWSVEDVLAESDDAEGVNAVAETDDPEDVNAVAETGEQGDAEVADAAEPVVDDEEDLGTADADEHETGDEEETSERADEIDTDDFADVDPVIELRGVRKRYDTGGEIVEALKGIDFVARPGEFVAIMGPSGSGKSTMLNVLGLLDAPTEGVVLLNGRDVTDLSDEEMTLERKRSIGFVFQNFYLIPTLTATENVEVPTLFDDDPTAHDRAIDLLSRVGLGDRLEHRPNQLSGGQKQRVAIARSLVNRPRILLADEPTGNLDRETGRTILEEFTRIKEEDDVAVIAVTHDSQVTKYADRTINLVDGLIRTEEDDYGT
nr:ABC transporter ATP-binding protein [Salinirubrum litoreum]